jgi:hypothetical protein
LTFPGRLLHDLLQRVRIAFAAAAETPERSLPTRFGCQCAPSAELATVDLGMRRFALVELPLRTYNTVASWRILF